MQALNNSAITHVSHFVLPAPRRLRRFTPVIHILGGQDGPGGDPARPAHKMIYTIPRREKKTFPQCKKESFNCPELSSPLKSAIRGSFSSQLDYLAANQTRSSQMKVSFEVIEVNVAAV